METRRYEIRVQDVLDEKWSGYFAPFELHTSERDTLLCGQACDQAELFGVLLKIRDLGLQLISVSVVEPQDNIA